MTHLVYQITGYGVPTDSRFEEGVRDRARKLAEKRPDFYRMEPGDGILWCATTDDDVFTPIYNWVLDNQGTEPE